MKKINLKFVFYVFIFILLQEEVKAGGKKFNRELLNSSTEAPTPPEENNAIMEYKNNYFLTLLEENKELTNRITYQEKQKTEEKKITQINEIIKFINEKYREKFSKEQDDNSNDLYKIKLKPENLVRFIEDERNLLVSGHYYYEGDKIGNSTAPCDLQLLTDKNNQKKLMIYVDNSDNPYDGGTFKETRFGFEYDELQLFVKLNLLNTAPSDEDQRLKDIKREIEILSRLKNQQGIASEMILTTNSKGDLFIVQPYHGEPLSRTKENLTLEERKKALYKILLGLSNIHSMEIVHNDIKPENILIQKIDNNLAIYIIDFGLSSSLGKRPSKNEFRDLRGTPAYFSPEKSTPHSSLRVTKKNDMWSLGIVALELVQGINTKEKIRNYIKNKYGLVNTSNAVKSISNIRNYDDINAIFGTNCNTTSTQSQFFSRDRLTIEKLICDMLHPNPNERVSSQLALKKMRKICKQENVLCD